MKVASFYHRKFAEKTRMRFDVIEVYTEDGMLGPRIKEIKHLEGAFDKSSAYDRKYYYQRKKEGSVL